MKLRILGLFAATALVAWGQTTILLTPETPVATQGSVTAILLGPALECQSIVSQFCSPNDGDNQIVWVMVEGPATAQISISYEVDGAVEIQQSECTATTASCAQYFIVPAGIVFDSAEITLPDPPSAARARSGGKKGGRK